MASKQNTSNNGVAGKIFSKKYFFKDNGSPDRIAVLGDSPSINREDRVNGLGCIGNCLFTDCFENVCSIQISDPGFLKNGVARKAINGIGGIGGSSYKECFKNTDSIDIKGPSHKDGHEVPFSLSVTSMEGKSNNPQKCLNGIGGIDGAVKFRNCFITDKKNCESSIVISSSFSSNNGSEKRVVTGIQGVCESTEYISCFQGQKSIKVAGCHRRKVPTSADKIGKTLSFKNCF